MTISCMFSSGFPDFILIFMKRKKLGLTRTTFTSILDSFVSSSVREMEVSLAPST